MEDQRLRELDKESPALPLDGWGGVDSRTDMENSTMPSETGWHEQGEHAQMKSELAVLVPGVEASSGCRLGRREL